MPDDLADSHSVDQEIKAWRKTLRGCSRAQRDELEDHVRSSLIDIGEVSLSPRERVLVAADRVGRPVLPPMVELSRSEIRLSFTWNATLAALLVLVIGAISIPVAMHGTWELFNEIDEPIDQMFGEGWADILEPVTQFAAVSLIVLALCVVWWRTWRGRTSPPATPGKLTA